MKKASSLLLTLLFFVAACTTSPRSAGQTLPPDLATGTAAMAVKLSAVANATSFPPTPQPAETQPAATFTWSPMPGEITAADTGKSFNITITSRISIILNESDYPAGNLQQDCAPADTLGSISNVPPVPPGYYVRRYEGIQLGQCTIRNGPFAVTINVVNQP